MENETLRLDKNVLAPVQVQRTVDGTPLMTNGVKPKFGDVFQGQAALEIKIDSLSEWRELIFAMDDQATKETDVNGRHRFPRKWVYRGQANANWKIRSSLEVITPKELLRNANAEQIIHEKELQTFLRFRRYGHPYVEPLDLNVVEWFAYMQHFGIKTRLVDFTESPYTALYFSQEDMKESGDFAVWGICISGLKGLDSISKLQEFKGADKDERKGLIGPLLDEVFSKQADTAANAAEQWSTANAILSEAAVSERKKNIYYVYPRWHNGRASAQSGLFLMPSHIAISFNDILMDLCSGGLAGSFSAHDVISNEKLGMAEIFARLNVVKFTFSAKLREEVHRLLKLMDKNPRTIYPDVDGLAKSLVNPFKSL